MNLKYSLAVLAVLLTASSSFAGEKSKVSEPTCVVLLNGGIEFPKKINPFQYPEKHFTYGLEVEYSLTEAKDSLFDHYGPSADFFSKEAWLQMSYADRRAWLKSHINDLFPEGPKAGGKLELISNHADLPTGLILDETGNVELISSGIFHSSLEFYAYIDRIQALLGEGYVQASLGVPSEVFYKKTSDSISFMGLRSFVAEMDILTKLTEGYERYLTNPKYVPAKSFTHPFLGPMNSNKINFFRSVFTTARTGDVPAFVLDRISKTDASYKYSSQVAYRPDILRKADWFILEVRQCVKDFDCLKKLLEREKFFINSELGAFSSFSTVTHMDMISDYNMLSPTTQEMLKDVFSNVVKRDVADEMLVTEVYRNFAYPLQDWSRWLKAMKFGPSSPIYRVVDHAQGAYSKSLESVATQYKAGILDRKGAENAVRIALAKFVHDSTLSVQFEVFMRSILPDAHKFFD